MSQYRGATGWNMWMNPRVCLARRLQSSLGAAKDLVGDDAGASRATVSYFHAAAGSFAALKDDVRALHGRARQAVSCCLRRRWCNAALMVLKIVLDAGHQS